MYRYVCRNNDMSILLNNVFPVSDLITPISNSGPLIAHLQKKPVKCFLLFFKVVFSISFPLRTCISKGECKENVARIPANSTGRQKLPNYLEGNQK